VLNQSWEYPENTVYVIHSRLLYFQTINQNLSSTLQRPPRITEILVVALIRPSSLVRLPSSGRPAVWIVIEFDTGSGRIPVLRGILSISLSSRSVSSWPLLDRCGARAESLDPSAAPADGLRMYWFRLSLLLDML